MMKKISMLLGGIIFTSLILISCRKESDFNPLNVNGSISADLTTQENSEYGNWLKFSTYEDYVSYTKAILEIENSDENTDSLLDILDQSNEIVSMRQFYSDTTDYEFPEYYDSICFVPGHLASITNKNSIFQINDTIVRIGLNYIFHINDGDVSSLDITQSLFADENIDEESLPGNISVSKINKSMNPEENELAGGGYNRSFTYQVDKYVNGNRYKLVAEFGCFSAEINKGKFDTKYYSAVKYEKGKKSFGTWKWDLDWSNPLELQVSNYYAMNNGFTSYHTKTGYLSNYGQRKRLTYYYYFVSGFTSYPIYFSEINYYSLHKSNRDGTVQQIITLP